MRGLLSKAVGSFFIAFSSEHEKKCHPKDLSKKKKERKKMSAKLNVMARLEGNESNAYSNDPGDHIHWLSNGLHGAQI